MTARGLPPLLPLGPQPHDVWEHPRRGLLSVHAVALAATERSALSSERLWPGGDLFRGHPSVGCLCVALPWNMCQKPVAGRLGPNGSCGRGRLAVTLVERVESRPWLPPWERSPPSFPSVPATCV